MKRITLIMSLIGLFLIFSVNETRAQERFTKKPSKCTKIKTKYAKRDMTSTCIKRGSKAHHRILKRRGLDRRSIRKYVPAPKPTGQRATNTIRTKRNNRIIK